ncbi:MAG: pantetheine-phosphate adenylyltransferase [Gammaproteobacteria bacterium RIFCSPHIGHO2_12_FULL_42_10]|nr:MAG: pantetheine-phosphate adenylyltransferase [Gammaproteobacteria bacterium RIFCSPHIGHO2_12_FULL_42_10]
MQRLAIYAGTFDPITFGHVDIVERASKLFDQVIVAVASNQPKHTLFSLEERVALTTDILQHVPNIKVRGFQTLTLDLAKELNAHVLIRSIRAVADFDYEFQLANMNRTLHPIMETLFLMPAEKYMFVSSSLIREIAALKGDITPFVPPLVAKALIQKMSHPCP